MLDLAPKAQSYLKYICENPPDSNSGHPIRVQKTGMNGDTHSEPGGPARLPALVGDGDT